MSLFKRNKDKQEDAAVAEETMIQVEPLHVTGEEFQTIIDSILSPQG